MPELLVEALAPSDRETAHEHIEGCFECTREWTEMRTAWAIMGDVPALEVPPRVRARFLESIGQPVAQPSGGSVVPFRSRPAVRWVAQAAGIALIAGGSWFAGHRTTATTPVSPLSPAASQSASFQTPASIDGVTPVSYKLAESREIRADELSPDIAGRPQIDNVSFQRDATGQGMTVSFDVTSHVTIKGKPSDPSLVNLLSYVLNDHDRPSVGRSKTIEWVRDTYADGQNQASPEIVRALANVLRNDTNEGARIKAVETLKSMPDSLAAEARAALIVAVENDPNPGVRIKAIEALAKLAHSGGSLDSAAVETLRKKATQDDENTYVRVKAAEALGQIHL